MKAWIYQDDKQVKKHGSAKASWYVGWIDPEGKRRCQSCGPGSEGKNAAQKQCRKIQAALIAGTYQSNAKKTWAEFRHEYEVKIIGGLAVRSRVEVLTAFDHFERIIGPKTMAALKTATIDEYTAKRRLEPGKKRGDTVSPATVNKELRHLRAALKKAHRWSYLAAVPYFDLEKEPKHLPTYVTGEHFAAIYKAASHARMPANEAYPADVWWRGVLVMGYMTGWRISEILALRREDLDLEGGAAITWAEDNKGKRDERVILHSVVVEHLRKLAGFDAHVFPWNHDRRTLQSEFARIQEAAGIHLPCRETHEHTRFCHVYGFHDLRRAFATMNADRLSADALQALMRHKSYSTTQKYVNMARQMNEAVASLHVPDILNKQNA